MCLCPRVQRSRWTDRMNSAVARSISWYAVAEALMGWQQRAHPAQRPYQRNGTTIASSSLTSCSHSGSEVTNRAWRTSNEPFPRAEGQGQPLTHMTYTSPSRAIEGATAITREPGSDSAGGCDHALPRGVRGQRTGRYRGRQAVPETTTGFGLHVPTRRATDAAANPSDKRAKRLNDRVAGRAAM